MPSPPTYTFVDSGYVVRANQNEYSCISGE